MLTRADVVGKQGPSAPPADVVGKRGASGPRLFGFLVWTTESDKTNGRQGAAAPGASLGIKESVEARRVTKMTPRVSWGRGGEGPQGSQPPLRAEARSRRALAQRGGARPKVGQGDNGPNSDHVWHPPAPPSAGALHLLPSRVLTTPETQAPAHKMRKRKY